MDDKDKTSRSGADADLARQIRKGRKFSLNEALGRMAGQGMMKGGSPVPPQQQAEFEIGLYLREHLSDASGVLPVVLLRRVKRSDLLLRDPDRPLVVLASYIRRILATPDRLRELVREADVEWGKVVGERPYFDKEEEPRHPDDPYTVESIRADLSRVLETLPSAER